MTTFLLIFYLHIKLCDSAPLFSVDTSAPRYDNLRMFPQSRCSVPQSLRGKKLLPVSPACEHTVAMSVPAICLQ